MQDHDARARGKGNPPGIPVCSSRHSINNVVSALKVLNGFTPGTCRFLRPVNDDDFIRPWTYGVGVNSMNVDFLLDEERVPNVTRAELLTRLKAAQ